MTNKHIAAHPDAQKPIAAHPDAQKPMAARPEGQKNSQKQHALKGQKLLAQGIALGIMAMGKAP